jgi:Tfp pilus assembly protein PilF
MAQDNATAEQQLKAAEEFQNKNMPDSAVFYYKKASADFKALNQTENFIKACNQIGVLLTRQDKYEEARSYLGQAMLAGQTLPDTNDLLRASTFVTLGVIYTSVGDFKGSLAFHERALAIRLFKLGENHADVATSYGNLGNVYFNKKNFDKALENHLKAKEIREKLFGKSSPEIAQSYYNLGLVYREMKQFDTSLDYFQKALRNTISAYGKEDKKLVRIYKAMSTVYDLMGNVEQRDACLFQAEQNSNN